MDALSDHGERELADPPRRERVDRDAASGRVGRPSGGERGCHRRRALRLGTDDSHARRDSGRDAGQQAAATNAGQHCVSRWRLLQQLKPGGAGAEDGLGLVVRMHRHSTTGGNPVLAYRQRVRVGRALNDQVRAVLADPGNLGRGRHRRHEDPGRNAEDARRVRHCRAVVTAGGGRNTSRWHRSQEQVRECAAHLERTGVLELLQLESQGAGRQAQFGPVDRDDRGAPDVAADDLRHVGDGCGSQPSYLRFWAIHEAIIPASGGRGRRPATSWPRADGKPGCGRDPVPFHNAAVETRPTFDELIAEGDAVPVAGWDFSWFEGRATEERPDWGYARLMGERITQARAALDIQTGGQRGRSGRR